MGQARLEKGKSDPITYTCTCPASSVGGTVLLFYRYWANIPELPEQVKDKTADLESLAAWHREQTERLNLTGKIRIAKEGYNITVAGTKDEISQYTEACVAHWSFAGLSLTTSSDSQQFFKPTPGCACVFGPSKTASVRITAEITPMGIEGYLPSDWSAIEVLPPAEFHRRCHEEKTLLMDVRNVYESRIGYFVDPRTGTPALRPPIRRFSQWPIYMRRRWREVEEKLDADRLCMERSGAGDEGEKGQIMTYCTGGIRCEKATRWMQEMVEVQERRKVCTLQGGIAAYLAWMDEEIRQGRREASESLFKGRNYVFDGRGSTGLSIGESTDLVSRCYICGDLTANLTKCGSVGCHLILVVCPGCEDKKPRCCADCAWINMEGIGTDGYKPRPMCGCEKEREKELWGEAPQKLSKAQGRKKAKRKAEVIADRINIPIKIIE
jgi:predicted sulfurtransferase